MAAPPIQPASDRANLDVPPFRPCSPTGRHPWSSITCAVRAVVRSSTASRTTEKHPQPPFDGGYPAAGLTSDASGNLYGTAEFGASVLSSSAWLFGKQRYGCRGG